MRVYADNAATTQMSRTAIDTMVYYMESEYGNPSSLHTPGQNAAAELAKARAGIAKNIGCKPGEIYFTSGGSEADNQAILSAAAFGESKGKKHIVSTAIEHHAVLHTLDRLKQKGFEITLVGVDESGIVTIDSIKEALREDTCLVTVMFANNEIGTIQPVSEIGKLCRSRGIIFHTDAVQAAGHLYIHVEEQNIDMLSLSAHKFHGPKGIGALYVRNGIKLTPLIEGGAQERGKRAGTENVPAIMAMSIALKEACANMQADTAKTLVLRERLIEGLEKIPHSSLNGDRFQRLPGNVSFCFEGIEGEALLLLLNQKGVYASSGSACTSGSLDPSHVLLAIGRPHEIAHGSLRLSLCAANTEEEMDYIIKSTGEVVAYLREISPIWADIQKGKKNHVI